MDFMGSDLIISYPYDIRDMHNIKVYNHELVNEKMLNKAFDYITTDKPLFAKFLQVPKPYHDLEVYDLRKTFKENMIPGPYKIAKNIH